MEWLDKQDTNQPFFGIFTYTLPHAELAQPDDSIFDSNEKVTMDYFDGISFVPALLSKDGQQSHPYLY